MRTDITMQTLAERYMELGAAVINDSKGKFGAEVSIFFEGGDPLPPEVTGSWDYQPPQPCIVGTSDALNKFLVAAFTIARQAAGDEAFLDE